MSHNIKVAIKVRPLIKREKDENLPIQWVVQGNSIVSTDSETKRRGDGGFCFDHIFDMNASNSEVFDTIVKPIVDATVSGFNGTVFAYGQTSSGKTYTMMGNVEEPGIIPLAVDHMFDAIANTVGREFLLRVSYLEIYNEKVNDLLNKSGKDLKLKEDGSGQVILQCKEEITNCPENVLSIMKKGDKNRRIGETNMNERSSRSHTIFRITIESREAGADSDGAIQVSQLNLVDLAGSERARQTGATGERFKEGRHINMSLSALGLVIMQLSESQDSQKHINFRDHKLTRLLQNSLGGNAMTVIICAVTPAALEETQCTLSFASRAKSVRNKPQVNEVMSDAALLKRYAKQLAKLQAELSRIKTKNRSAEVEEMESKLQEKDRINQLLEERIELLKTRIVSGDTTTNQESFKCKSKRRQTWGGPGMFNQQLPVFSSKSSLTPVKEMSFEKPHRKSIIQSVDIMNQTFQTAFTDFELELFESERDRISGDDASDSEEEPFVTKRHVTFKDDVFTIRSNNSLTPEKNATPKRNNISTQTRSYQSPSTPKHVLRERIVKLSNEYEELCEYTTLEKQLLCQIEFTPEVKEQLNRRNLAEGKGIQCIIAELCAKLNEAEERSRLEKDGNKKMMKQLGELQTQIQNITSERNEFEYISGELRAQLKTKTTELELKNMTEENIRAEERKKISVLEKQVDNIVVEKKSLEHTIAELRTESAKKLTELQQQIYNVTSERNEFEYMHRELSAKLTRKSLELEELKKDPGGTSAEMESIISERNEYQRINAELSQRISELESKIVLEQTANQNATTRISELESKIMLEQTANRNATTRISELENQIEVQIDIESLQKTISMLTTENMEMATKLTAEQENAKQAELNLQKTIDDLYERLSEVTNQKISLESDLATLKEQLESIQSRTSDMISQEELLTTYQSKIDKLTTENIELSAFVAEKNRELESIKESKSLLYDHECIYKEKLAVLAQKNECLSSENSELSTDLMDKIEENDSLKEQCDVLKNKVEQLLTTKDNCLGDDVEHIRSENNVLKAEIIELKTKAAILSNENTKFSDNLLETMENLNCSYNDRFPNNTLHLSTIFDDAANRINESLQENLQEKSREALMDEITTLQDKIRHLIRLNGKLSDLKLTSCNRCAHLREMNESRRTLKIETKALNQKLEDLQRKFDQKCVDTEMLKSKVNGELISNVQSNSPNVSFVDEMNVSFIEEKIQILNDELHTLKADHDKLSVLYKDKSDEYEQLQHDLIVNTDVNQDSTSKENKNGSRIEQIQNHIDELSISINDLKKNSANFSIMLDQFKQEKVNLLDEISKLKISREELQRTAMEKMRSFEDDFSNMSKEIEQFLMQEKSQRLMLEVEFEDLKAKEQDKSSLIDQLHEHISSLKYELELITTEKNELAASSIMQYKYKEELELLKKQYETKEQDKSSLIDQLHEHISSLKHELELITTEKNELAASSIMQYKYKEELELLKKQYETKEQDKSSLIDQLHEHISSLKHELELITTEKNELAASSIMECKYREELELLKKQYEDLEKANLQSGEIEQRSTLRIEELEACIETLQKNIVKQECLCKEFEEKSVHLERLLQESEQEKCVLVQKVQTIETDLLNVKNNLESKFKNEFDSMSAQYELYIKETETNLQNLNDTLNKYVDENLDLTQELTRVRNIEEKFNEMTNENERLRSKEKLLISSNEKLTNELNDTRQCVIKELKSLKCDTNPADLSDMSITDIFVILLQALVSKENEIIKTMRETFKKNQRKLEDEKQQSVDTEKRTTVWAKELEAEIEKLQTELTERECDQKEYRNKISQLEHLLMECNHEREILKEKVEALETDFHNLQIEFDKQCKVDSQQEEAILIAQKKEREAEKIFKNKEVELESKLKSEKELFGKKLNDLIHTVESYKTKNLELSSTIEGLEANEKQLKNIIEANSTEMQRKSQNIERLTTELEQLTEAYNEVNQAMEQKTSYIEEITAVLKTKCDMLSEYKTKCETITPEYEMLKERIKNQETTIGRYKEEIETLKKEKETELEIIRDALNSEEIKNAALTKQLNELSNRNITLIEELNELKGKYEELQQINAKLEKKLRDSTSKIKAKAEIEEAKELNKQLQNNLEGASNRIAELQEIKNQTLKELVDLKSKYELVLQENAETKSAFSLYKSKYNISSLTVEEDKYNALLFEKNKIALELEDKKLILNGKDAELKECANRIQQLTEANKELDDELEEYAAIIRDRDNEISNLEEKLHSRLTENSVITELEGKLKDRREENEKLRAQVEGLKMRLDMKQTEDCRPELETVIRTAKLSEYEEKYQQLKKKVHELELQLVSKNGKIATLEIQIQSENFPYQRKCKELEELLLAFRNKNAELNAEVRKLQRTVNDINTWECEVCRRWRVNRKDQACQTIPNNMLRFCSTNSGVIEDHVRIQKLEKEKMLMKDLCRSRSRRIKELEDRIQELEVQSSIVSRRVENSGIR